MLTVVARFSYSLKTKGTETKIVYVYETLGHENCKILQLG